MKERKRRGNGGTAFEVDIEVEGTKTWKGVEKAMVLVLVMAASVLAC
jgi:hypothetical protein